MIYGIIIIVAVAIILFILIRRLPDTIVTAPNTKDIVKPGKEKEVEAGKPIVKAGLSSEALILKADQLFERKRYKKAEELYIKAAALDPNNAKIYNRLGVIYLEEKNFKDARDCFQTALNYNRRIPSRHVNLGLSYMGMGRCDQAVKCFQRALALDLNNPKYQKLLDDANERLRKKE